MPDLNYHIWHHPDLDGQPGFATTSIEVPTLEGTGSETKVVQSLKNDLAKLRADGAAKGIVEAGFTDIGKSTNDRELWALKVGKGTAQRVLFTGCHHAREWISVEVPYLVAKYLIETYTDQPTTPVEKRIKHLLDNRQIWFVPLSNPDGHMFTMQRQRVWRPNRKAYDLPADEFDAPAFGGGTPRRIKVKAAIYTGVDINRNYPTSNWGQETFLDGSVRTSRDPADGGAVGSATAPGRGIWAGPSKGSEVETKLIAGLADNPGFRAAITYHNWSQLLLYPTVGENDPYLQFVGRGMSALIDEHGNPYTYQSGSALYPTTGDAMEFYWEKAASRPSFTPELRPADGAPEEHHFSGLPEAQIFDTFKENLGAALALINSAGFDQPAGPVRRPAQGQNGTFQVVRNCWKVFQGWVP